MGSFLQLLQRWSYRALRLLLWAVAAQRQLTQITVFAVFFLVASFQMGVARFLAHGSEPLGARGTLQASLAMFTASLQGVAASPFLPILQRLVVQP
ncbi:MAG: hypothetical protein R6W06_08520 [Prochlorococcaceae cyanobacterium]